MVEAKEEGPKRLQRSSVDKIIAGVCGGLADYFNIDPAFIRLIFVLLAIGKGFGVVLYLILWIVMPERAVAPSGVETKGATKKQVSRDFTDEIADDFHAFASGIKDRAKGVSHRRDIFAVIIIAVGLISLVNQLFPSVWFRGDVIGPVLLIIVGGYILLKR